MAILKNFHMEDEAEESFAYFSGVLLQNLTANHI